ncbi:GNAT family N-acetyltransferase [Zunongwangia endophytica]|uniref:GNAT family N-acetyltransferase n=1 Tax=Zunongwangia endophytica TaxID=1808945 RepID=A0ABV8HCD4_9FLAO|nr:GNAT family N-acetyltransferase [Zunongwangia endophytica]MDN3593606.1 GNAT family N-acetyltransferase [Zunongwangia endophytica]
MVDFDLNLENENILLRPLEFQDFDEISELTKKPEMWYYFTSDLSNPEGLKNWIDTAVEERKNQKRLAFAIIEKSSEKLIGSTSLGNYSERDQRIEIGWTWLGKEFQGKGYNFQAKQLLLKYCFESLKLERVEAKTDILNNAAKNSLAKSGFTEEGILRSHTLMTNNRRRDTAYFSVLKEEYLNNYH